MSKMKWQQEGTYTEYDVVTDLGNMIAIAPEQMSYNSLQGFVHNCIEMMDRYTKDKEFVTLEVEKLKLEHMQDEQLNAIGLKYNLTMNQVHGLMEMSDKMNKQLGEGTGVVVVPFWFHEQYVELKELNQTLSDNAANLSKTVEEMAKKAQESIDTNSVTFKSSDLLEYRSNLITGVQEPYIAGVTGPRLGDEHLDEDNIHNYLPHNMKGKH